jgi:hypothetical protein
MRLGLGQGLGAGQSSGGLTIVRDGLVMQHKYNSSAVQSLNDGAAFFDGTDDRIALGSQTNVAGGALTMSAWVYLIQDQQAPVLSFGDALLRFQSADDLRAWGDVSGGSISSGITSALNRWTHVVFTHDAGTGKLYADGLQVASTSHTVLSADSRSSYIGNYSSGYFEGYISNVGYWTRALSQSEIKSIMFKQYADLTTSEKTSLVSFWNLDSTVADGIPLIYDENNTTLGPDLWSITDPIGPDTLGGADGDKNASMDLSDVGLAAGDVIKLSATISGSDGGRILAPDVGAGTSGVTRIPSDADYQHKN